MSNMLRAGKANMAKMLLQRAGHNITVRRPDGTEPDNIFGKKDDADITFNTVSTDEHAYRITSSESERMGGMRTRGGQVDSQNPLLVLPDDTSVQEGDFVDFPDGLTYHISEKPDDQVSYKLVAATLDTR